MVDKISRFVCWFSLGQIPSCFVETSKRLAGHRRRAPEASRGDGSNEGDSEGDLPLRRMGFFGGRCALGFQKPLFLRSLAEQPSCFPKGFMGGRCGLLILVLRTSGDFLSLGPY